MKNTNTDVIAGMELYAALFQDIAAWDSGLQESLRQDYLALEELATTQGLHPLMIDLPDAGRTIDQALSGGHLDSSKLPDVFGSLTTTGSRPLFLGLIRRVFMPDGSLIPDVHPTSVWFLRQVLYLLKKARKDCSNAATLSEVEAFNTVDSRLRHPHALWDGDDCDFMSYRDLHLLDAHQDSPDLFGVSEECPPALCAQAQAVADRIISRFKPLDWRDIKPKHGPGAVSDAKSGTDKYLFPCWPAKLDGFFPYVYFAQSREDLHYEVVIPTARSEPPSRLLAVPKTLKGPRMIASEPTSHQFLQLGLMRWLRENLPSALKTCIDFKDQIPSREMCLESSITGKFATVDLSAASDRLSCWVVERVFRRHHVLLSALHATRTRWLYNATGIGDPFYIKLKKFAPMGSGVTFPVQSIVYAIMAIAAVLHERGMPTSWQTICSVAREVRVFGDDIILPSQCVGHLTALLTYCQLKVNVSKTHVGGHFRESCGMDAFAGVDVTPAYVRDFQLGNTAEDLGSWVAVSNNCYRKGLWTLSDLMVSKIPPEVLRLIPVHHEELGCLTLLSFQANPPKRKTRYNRALFREEVQGLSILVSPVTMQRDSYQSLLQYFVEEPNPETTWSSGYLVRDRIRLRKRWVPYYKEVGVDWSDR